MGGAPPHSPRRPRRWHRAEPRGAVGCPSVRPSVRPPPRATPPPWRRVWPKLRGTPGGGEGRTGNCCSGCGHWRYGGGGGSRAGLLTREGLDGADGPVLVRVIHEGVAGLEQDLAGQGQLPVAEELPEVVGGGGGAEVADVELVHLPGGGCRGPGAAWSGDSSGRRPTRSAGPRGATRAARRRAAPPPARPCCRLPPGCAACERARVGRTKQPPPPPAPLPRAAGPPRPAQPPPAVGPRGWVPRDGSARTGGGCSGRAESREPPLLRGVCERQKSCFQLLPQEAVLLEPTPCPLAPHALPARRQPPLSRSHLPTQPAPPASTAAARGSSVPAGPQLGAPPTLLASLRPFPYHRQPGKRRCWKQYPLNDSTTL